MTNLVCSIKHTQITIGRSSDVFGVRHNIGGNAYIAIGRVYPLEGSKIKWHLWEFKGQYWLDSAAINVLLLDSCVANHIADEILYPL